MSNDLVLQIVPRISNQPDGVTDYALNLAKGLLTNHGLRTVFVASEIQASQKGGFEIVALNDTSTLPPKAAHFILHYINYGYQKRGLPFFLAATVRQLRHCCSARLLVIFHELFATGPLWKSAFWLQPWQKKIARDVARLADARLVSSESMRGMLEKIAPGLDAVVHPVPSAFGEPLIDVDQLRARNNHRWVICGGRQLVERSLRSLLQILNAIPSAVVPKELVVLGGSENPMVAQMLTSLRDTRCEYHPRVSAGKASEMLSSCAFGWLDYFTTKNPKPDLLLKSSSFANMCANGVVCVMPQAFGSISLEGDALPGPFTIGRDGVALPSASDRPTVASTIQEWYRRHGSIASLARVIAENLG